METLEKFGLGIAGQAGDYWGGTVEDTLYVLHDDVETLRRSVPGLEAFVMKAKDLRCGWGQFPDGMEVVYVYDRGDDNFGYAANLQDEGCSEWGYAPFPQTPEGR